MKKKKGETFNRYFKLLHKISNQNQNLHKIIS